ncbi:Fe2+-enterobactin ABC transporter substrate-binding protein [Nocardia puris]|uniref:Iron complex transport system substrate-binding protein n=1 Tax=Nocardia puris TaxID=208602 RepID=A0A366DUJ2_9NOCA|nr:Fe2+-enterobactin ABC transporter substrate-binding protein [Nocardia puris]RBO92878.1 iron complex transport system substrate-binding protein [Nocardia puris]
MALLALLLAAVLAVAGCSGSDDTSATGDTASSGAWPRTFTNADGTTTEIPAQPQRIVSTGVSVTGTLLAIDAPVVASAAATEGRFFDQWADVAAERGVENLWSVGTFDVEAVYAAEPDLIVVVTSGRDALVDQVGELGRIAPTIVVDYGGQTWQSLARQLGTATGLEERAEQVIADFDANVAEAKAKITVPAGKANIISYNGPGQDNPIARAGGAQAELLTALGFTVEDPDPSWHTQPQPRADFVWTAYENLTKLTAETTFILSADNARAAGFRDDPVLANVPSVKANQVYGLGLNSFRMDYYSAIEIVDGVVENFGK